MAPESAFNCRCGTTLEATAPVGVDAAVHRCSGCGAIAQKFDETCDYCGAGIIHAPARGSLICPGCMARNLDDARFCLACGIGFEPQVPPQNAPELRCPSCECWMTPREVGGLVVQECPKCNGLWAVKNVFDSLVDRATSAARENAQAGEIAAPRVDGGNPASGRVEYRRCPTCDAMMARRNFRKRSGVIIDQCHEHGTWLDANELERIAGFVLSGRADALEKTLAAERDVRDSQGARVAARRLQMAAIRELPYESSLFGHRRGTSAAGTVLDLLISILN